MDIICYIVVLAIVIFAIVSFIKAIKRAMHTIKYESNPNTIVTYSGYYADKHDQYIDDWQLLINIAFIKDAIDYHYSIKRVYLLIAKFEKSNGL